MTRTMPISSSNCCRGRAIEKDCPIAFGFGKPGSKKRTPTTRLPVLTAVLDTKLPADLPSSDDKREALAKRQANAAVALLRINQPAKVWPLLKHSPDPRVRSYLIHRLGPMGADAGAIVKQLDMESDLTIRRALILTLGEYGETDFTPDARNALLPKLQEMYRTASDPGLHAACEWLLRRWKQEAWLTQVNEEWVKDKEQREKRLEGIGKVFRASAYQTLLSVRTSVRKSVL